MSDSQTETSPSAESDVAMPYMTETVDGWVLDSALFDPKRSEASSLRSTYSSSFSSS